MLDPNAFSCPARVVAITQLTLELLEILTDKGPENLRGVEADLAKLLIPLRADLQTILADARAEMSQLAPAVLAS